MFKISFDFCSPDTNCRQLIIGKEITIFESHSFPKINNLVISSSLNGYTPRGSRCIVAFIRLSILICLQLILKWSSALEDKLVQRSKFTWCETVPNFLNKVAIRVNYRKTRFSWGFWFVFSLHAYILQTVC